MGCAVAWRGLARVVESRGLGKSYHSLTLRAPEVASAVVPGQFLHVLCPPGGATGVPFLRRPLSVHDADPERGLVNLLFAVKGPGTAGLAALLRGEALDVIGPLGGGVFPLLPGPALVVGGGVGLAPLLLLVKRLAERGAAIAPLHVVAGVASAQDLVLVEPFRRLEGLSGLAVTTEDGTPGTARGTVLAALPDPLPPDIAVYACGPRPMLKAVWEYLSRWPGLSAWFSVEERLACGVGACLGCPVAVRAEPEAAVSYRRVCRDGPVFDAGLLDWGAL